METQRYWIGVASRDHVMRGVAGGFTQLNHGKNAPLKRMGVGDWLIYYAPRVAFGGNEACQAFVAIGQVTGAAPYEAEMTPTFTAARRDVRYIPAHDAPIQPLIGSLSFIHDPQRWGYPFRFGHFEIVRADFERIAAAMEADIS